MRPLDYYKIINKEMLYILSVLSKNYFKLAMFFIFFRLIILITKVLKKISTLLSLIIDLINIFITVTTITFTSSHIILKALKNEKNGGKNDNKGDDGGDDDDGDDDDGDDDWQTEIGSDDEADSPQSSEESKAGGEEEIKDKAGGEEEIKDKAGGEDKKNLKNKLMRSLIHKASELRRYNILLLRFIDPDNFNKNKSEFGQIINDSIWLERILELYINNFVPRLREILLSNFTYYNMTLGTTVWVTIRYYRRFRSKVINTDILHRHPYRRFLRPFHRIIPWTFTAAGIPSSSILTRIFTLLRFLASKKKF